MGTVITKFVYSDIEDAIHYSSYYSDLLTSYNNKFDSNIYSDGECFTLVFKIYDTSGGKNSPRNSEGTRYLSESSSENS